MRKKRGGGPRGSQIKWRLWRRGNATQMWESQGASYENVGKSFAGEVSCETGYLLPNWMSMPPATITTRPIHVVPGTLSLNAKRPKSTLTTANTAT